MLQAVIASWPLLLGIALLMLGNGLQGTLLGVRADLENFPTPLTGLVMSAFYLGLLLGSLTAPRLIGRVGHVRVFAAFAAIASAAVLLHAVVPDVYVWIIVRAGAGFSFAALFIVAESWLNSQARNQDRAKLLSLYMVITFGGAGLGQLLMNLADPAGFTLFAIVSVLLSVAVVPMLLTTGPAPTIVPGERLTLAELYRSSPLGIVGSFTSGASIGAVLGMGAVFAAQAGLSVAQVAQFMFAVLFAGMLGQVPIGHLADRFDRRVVLIGAAALGGSLALGAAIVDGPLGLVLLISASLFAFPLYSVSVAHANDYLETDAMVGAAAGLMIANGIGAALGPFLASVVMSALGPQGFAAYLAVALGTLALFGLYRATQRPSVPLDDQGPTLPIPRATPVATVLAQTAAIEQIEADGEQSESLTAPPAPAPPSLV